MVMPPLCADLESKCTKTAEVSVRILHVVAQCLHATARQLSLNCKYIRKYSLHGAHVCASVSARVSAAGVHVFGMQIQNFIMGGAIGAVLALCVGILLYLARKNPERIRQIALSFLRTRCGPM